MHKVVKEVKAHAVCLYVLAMFSREGMLPKPNLEGGGVRVSSWIEYIAHINLCSMMKFKQWFDDLRDSNSLNEKS